MPYHGIQPILTFRAPHHPLNLPQFVWHEHESGVHSALFAGKHMDICINDDRETYQLTYLDMAHPNHFTTVEGAKVAAPDFARAVLLYMISVVGLHKEDVGLLAHIPSFHIQLAG